MRGARSDVGESSKSSRLALENIALSVSHWICFLIVSRRKIAQAGVRISVSNIAKLFP
jgi:hypothetical protein